MEQSYLPFITFVVLMTLVGSLGLYYIPVVDSSREPESFLGFIRYSTQRLLRRASWILLVVAGINVALLLLAVIDGKI